MAIEPGTLRLSVVECGCVLVRHGALLREAFSLVPPYLRTEEGRGFGGLPWYAEYGVQQTRGFRAMKLWTVLRHAGRAGLVEMVSRHIALAERLVAAIAAAPDLELMAPAPLSIVCWRYVPTHRVLSPSALDALNKELAELQQQRGEAFLTHTTLKGCLCLRTNVLHFATTEADIDFLVHMVRTTGAELADRHETLA